jgi:hypothetical protein
MARRTQDADGVAQAIAQFNIDFDKTAAARAAGVEQRIITTAGRIFEGAYAFHHVVNRRTVDCFIGKTEQRILPVHNAGSDRILQAELGFQTGFRLIIG